MTFRTMCPIIKLFFAFLGDYMDLENSKLLFEAVQGVLQDKSQGSVGQAFAVCQEELQGIFSSLSIGQQDSIHRYNQALYDVFEAAIDCCIKKPG